MLNVGYSLRLPLPMDRLTYQHYEIARRPDGTPWELGRGAMGVTYKALDTNLHVPVALKVIASELLPDARARARFLREARAAAQLRHNHVAAVYHLGQEADGVFYTMEFIEGETLEALVRRDGPVPTMTALALIEQASRALQAAHSRGLLHRDLKPSNLMLAREVDGSPLVKVIDFGLVKPLAPDEGEETSAVNASLSRGLFLGTPLYASPEQCAQDEGIDARADLYSLGATLWFLLAGEPPFRGNTRTVMAQHLSKPPPLDRLGANQPPAVVALLAALLAKEPEDRPADAGELRARLGEILRGEPLTPISRPVAPPPPPVPVAVETFTLADLLAARGNKLPAHEVAVLLFPLAAILDEAGGNAPRPTTPAGVRARMAAGNPPGRERPLTGWGNFTLDLVPGTGGATPDPSAALAGIVGALLADPGAFAAEMLGDAATGEGHFPTAAALAIALLAGLVRGGQPAGAAAGVEVGSNEVGGLPGLFARWLNRRRG